MTWNIEEAKDWMIKYANTLSSNGDTKASQALLYDVFYLDSCRSEESFKHSLRTYSGLDDIYIAWALKEVRHDG